MEAAQSWAPDLDELDRIADGQKPHALAVRFYVEPVEDALASKNAGKLIFRDEEMIEIRIDSRDIRNRPVSNEDKREYAAIYAAFARGQSQEAAEGYPIKNWPPARKGEAETLYMNGIRTVEQLALAADGRIQVLGPFMALRETARKWLSEQEKGRGLVKLSAENDDLRARVTALEKMLDTQSAEIATARGNGGSLPAASPSDARMAALEAQIAAMARNTTETRWAPPTPADPAEAPKNKGGRPKGSKNKAKVVEEPKEG